MSQFSPQPITDESIINSGNLGIISDYDLMEWIVLYYRSIEEGKLREKLYSDYILDYATPFIFEHMDLSEGRLVSTAVVGSTLLRNLIVGYNTLLAQCVDGYRELQDHNEGLRKALGAESRR